MARQSKEFLSAPIVNQHLELAAGFLSATIARRFTQAIRGMLAHRPSLQFDSPLEAMFWLWWQACDEAFDGAAGAFILRPQVDVVVSGKNYRVDFLLEPASPSVSSSDDWSPIAIELDGHAFHERTKAHVIARDERDRALQAAGWKVLHYSFTAMNDDPVKCITDAWGIAIGQERRVMDAQRAKA